MHKLNHQVYSDIYFLIVLFYLMQQFVDTNDEIDDKYVDDEYEFVNMTCMMAHIDTDKIKLHTCVEIPLYKLLSYFKG